MQSHFDKPVVACIIVVIDNVLTPIFGLVSKAFSAAVKLLTGVFNFIKEKISADIKFGGSTRLS